MMSEKPFSKFEIMFCFLLVLYYSNHFFVFMFFVDFVFPTLYSNVIESSSVIAANAPYRVEITYSRESSLCQLYVDAAFETAVQCDLGDLKDANEYSPHNQEGTIMDELKNTVTEM